MKAWSPSTWFLLGSVALSVSACSAGNDDAPLNADGTYAENIDCMGNENQVPDANGDVQIPEAGIILHVTDNFDNPAGAMAPFTDRSFRDGPEDPANPGTFLPVPFRGVEEGEIGNSGVSTTAGARSANLLLETPRCGSTGAANIGTFGSDTDDPTDDVQFARFGASFFPSPTLATELAAAPESYEGIAFWVKGGRINRSNARIGVNDGTTIPGRANTRCQDPPIDETAGAQYNPRAREFCYDASVQQYNVTRAWRLIKIPFTDLSQNGWGYPNAELDLTDFIGLDFSIQHFVDVDIWIDDLGLYRRM